MVTDISRLRESDSAHVNVLGGILDVTGAPWMTRPVLWFHKHLGLVYTSSFMT